MAQGHPQESLVTEYSGRLANLIAATSFLTFLGRGAIPPLLPRLVTDLSISLSQAGLGLTVLWLSYAVFHYPGGRLSDQLTRKTPLVASLGLLIVGFTMLTVNPTYASFLLGVALVGTGHGLFMPASRGLIADLFVERRAQAFGLQVGAASAGSALSAGLAVVVVAVATWQTAFVPSVVGLFVIALLMHHWNRETYRVARIELGLGNTVTRLLTSPRMRTILAAYCLFSFSWLGVISFLPTYLHVGKGFSLTIGSAAYALVYVIGIVASPIAGNLADRFPRLLTAAGALTVAAVGLAGLLMVDSLALIGVSTAVFGIGLFGTPPVLQSAMFDAFPDDSLAGDFGAMKTIYTAIGALGPGYVGIVVERASYRPAFVSFVFCLVVAILALVQASRMAE
ncbi:MFS transporter [Haloarculaceae archaeon H-GB2-1]|nr:MFS transporter [Haloarculaceae archaeon H-GB1-1]MEA5386841.1 MFS transporter [Haloarculaceae archaeon H-GB11]MEA5408316.1 MFS transporter [Haloarculaceae archaeon H-GB2-1]